MSFRKEKKFRLSVLEFNQAKDLLLKKGAINLFKKRNVNSLYFDSTNLDMYQQSEEGLLPRKKVRIRWYNQERLFVLEKKYSSIEGRYKKTFPIEKKNCFEEILQYKIFDELYGSLSPSLFVSYERSYLKFNDIRITFDTKIVYRNMRSFIENKIEDPERVMELKTGIYISDDFIGRFFPYPKSRFSKYSRGLFFTQGDF